MVQEIRATYGMQKMREGIMVMECKDISQDSYDLQLLKEFDAIVIGAGFAGAVAARELAESCGKRVAVIEKRSHIGGNSHDCYDDNGVLIHKYGPHVFHTESERAYEYLSRFTDWYDYKHKVVAYIRGYHVTVPFNINSVLISFDEQTSQLMIGRLIRVFGRGGKTTVLELRSHEDPIMRELGEYVYQNVFLKYTIKQWGLRPEQIDPSVTARVPVIVGRDDHYFQDPYQGVPKDGYTAAFERILDHPNIEVLLNLDARQILSLTGSDGEDEGFTGVEVCGSPYEGIVIYTGALDELCDERFGLLPYRSLDFEYRRYDKNHVQPVGTINFTVHEDFTRTTEYTWLTGQEIEASTIAVEYPCPYTDPATQIPYYPIINNENQVFYDRYRKLFDKLGNFHALGRLAEYRYYNMDQIVLRALELIDEISNDAPA